MSEQFFWCGWTVPLDYPRDKMAAAWPRSMKGWKSGESHTHAMWVGLVWAADEDAAWAVVTSCYRDREAKIESRWSPCPEGPEWKAENRYARFGLPRSVLLEMMGKAPEPRVSKRAQRRARGRGK